MHSLFIHCCHLKLKYLKHNNNCSINKKETEHDIPVQCLPCIVQTTTCCMLHSHTNTYMPHIGAVQKSGQSLSECQQGKMCWASISS